MLPFKFQGYFKILQVLSVFWEVGRRKKILFPSSNRYVQTLPLSDCMCVCVCYTPKDLRDCYRSPLEVWFNQ